MAALTRTAPSEQERKSHEMGMHTEQLTGRTQQVFFDARVLVLPGPSSAAVGLRRVQSVSSVQFWALALDPLQRHAD